MKPSSLGKGRRRQVAVLISGHGTNLQALIDAARRPDYPAEIALVLSSRADAYGLKRAEAAGVPSHVIGHRDYESRENFDRAMHEALMRHEIELVCLAGFMRLLSSWFVDEWHDRLINIHPSLLPAFRGVNVHEAVLEAGVRFTGCTVHFVRSAMDVGPIIIQAVVPVLPDDMPEALAERVHAQEHRIYPAALRWLAEGKLTVQDERVLVTDGASPLQALINPLA